MNKALITGANKGIGYGIAAELVQKGWHVLVGARNKERGMAAVEALNKLGNGCAEWIHVNLSDYDSMAETCQEVAQKHADLQLLINNAGIPGDMSVSSYDTKLADIIETTQVNFFGTFCLSQGIIPVLAKNKGRMVNITVPTATNPYWNPLAYKASKAAQNCMTEHFALDFQKNNVPVEAFAIHPGPTTTDLNGNMDLPGFHKPDEVGRKIVDLLFDGNSHQGEFIEIFPIVAE